MNSNKKIYSAPQLDVCEICVEHGFAGSSGANVVFPDFNPDGSGDNWFQPDDYE